MTGFLPTTGAEGTTALLGAFLVVLLTWIIIRQLWWTKPLKLPPGPWGLPVVGYVPFMSKLPHEKFAKLGEKYGQIFSIRMGNRLVVVLGSYDVIREALIKQADNFSGRPHFQIFSSYKQENLGIIMNDGESWKEFRRFSLMTLRDFGLGKMNIEPRITEEVQHYLAAIDKFEGQPFNIGDLTRLSVSNVICSIMFGYRFDYDDPKFQRLLHTLAEHVRRIQIAGIFEFLPWLTRIPGITKIMGSKPLSTTGTEIGDGIQQIINQHVSNHKAESQDDFIDAWITEGENRGTDLRYIKVDCLQGVLRSLFVAGSDTTATTLRWSLLYLMKHPDVQAKVQKEIDDVVGHERTPSLMDRSNMHYTEAVLAEVQRISTIVPLAITHRNFEETTLCGYTIPKGTVIMPNLWAVHHDSRFFPQPDKFMPDRFLDESGKLKKIEQFIPFSLGKRQCLGEAMAKAELFLYFTCMLQRFNFKSPEGAKLSFEYKYSAVSLPNDYQVCAVGRSTDD